MNKIQEKDSICFSQHWIVDFLNSNQERVIQKIINGDLPNALGDIVPNYTIMLNVGGKPIEDKFLAAQTFLDWARDESFINDHHRIVFDFAHSSKMDIPKIQAIEDRDQQNNTIKIDYEKLVQQKFNTDLTLDQIESIYVKAFELEDVKLKNEYGITNTEFISFSDLVHKYLSDEEIAQQPYINAILEKRVLSVSAILDSTRIISAALHFMDEENIAIKDFDMTKDSIHNNGDFSLSNNTIMVGHVNNTGQLLQVNGSSPILDNALKILNESCILSLDKNPEIIPYESWQMFKEHVLNSEPWTTDTTLNICTNYLGKSNLNEEEFDQCLMEIAIAAPRELTLIPHLVTNEICMANTMEYIITPSDDRYGGSWVENQALFHPNRYTHKMNMYTANHPKIGLEKEYHEVDYINAPLWSQDQDIVTTKILADFDLFGQKTTDHCFV